MSKARDVVYGLVDEVFGPEDFEDEDSLLRSEVEHLLDTIEAGGFPDYSSFETGWPEYPILSGGITDAQANDTLTVLNRYRNEMQACLDTCTFIMDRIAAKHNLQCPPLESADKAALDIIREIRGSGQEETVTPALRVTITLLLLAIRRNGLNPVEMLLTSHAISDPAGESEKRQLHSDYKQLMDKTTAIVREAMYYGVSLEDGGNSKMEWATR